MKLNINLNTIKSVAMFVAPVAISAGTTYFSTKEHKLNKLAEETIAAKKVAEAKFNNQEITWDELKAERGQLINGALSQESDIKKSARKVAYKKFGTGLAFAAAGLVASKKFGWKVGLAIEAAALIAETFIDYKDRATYMTKEENLKEIKSDLKMGLMFIAGKGVFKYAFNKGFSEGSKDMGGYLHAVGTSNILKEEFPDAEITLYPEYGAKIKATFDKTIPGEKIDAAMAKAAKAAKVLYGNFNEGVAL